jgi:hypothetical protein
MTISLNATYTGPTAGIEAKVVLRQRPWSRYTGRVTKQAAVRWLLAIVDGSSAQVQIDCGMEGDALICPIEAYPVEAGVDYRLVASWGELSDRSVRIVAISDEQVQFRLTDTATTEFPAREIRSVRWTDVCLDSEGRVVGAPELTTSGTAIKSSAVVYGTASVSYLTEQHGYILNAPRRADAIDSHFSAVVVAVVPGYVPVPLVLDMPPGIETFEDDSHAVCGRSRSGSVAGGDGGSGTPPAPLVADLVTEVDYCEQSTLREYTQR